MVDSFDGSAGASDADRLRICEENNERRASTIDLIAEHAPLDRTLDAVCDVVEGALPGTQALVMTSDSEYPLRVFHEVDFPRAVTEDLTTRVAAWLERAPFVQPKQGRVMVDDPSGGDERTWCVPITGLGARPLGALCIRRRWNGAPTAQADRLARQAGRIAQVAIEHHLAERQVIGLLAAERKQIASDLHDDPVQAVTAVGLILQRLAMEVPTEQAELLGQARETVNRAIERMRRMLFELHPAALEEDGLAAAVEVYLEETFEPLGIGWELDDALTGEPDVTVGVLAYRLIHEALANVVAHAHASHVSVALANGERGLSATIVDDGCGFDPAAIPRIRPGHIGIATARDLARRSSGSLEVESRPGSGCTVRIQLPLTPTHSRGPISQ